MSKKSQGKHGETKSATSKNMEERAQLKEEIKQLKSECKDQTQKIKGLNKKVKDLESELANAKHGLESKAPDFLDVISSDTIENYQEKMKQLEEENKRLKSRHNGTDNGEGIEKENTLLVERNKELDSEVQKLKKQLQKQPTVVPQKGTDTEPDKSDSNTLKVNLQQCRDKLKKLEQERDRLKEEVAEMKMENEGLNAENNELKKKQAQEEENTTDTKMAEFEKVNKENTSLREELDSLQVEIRRVTDDNNRLKAKNADRNTKTEGDMGTKDAAIKLKDVELQMKKMEEEKDNLIAQKESNSKDMSKLKEEKASLEKDLNKQENKISNLKKEKEDLEKEMKDIQSKMKKMEHEADRLIAQNTDSNSKDMSKLKEEKASLEKDLKKQENKISNLKKEKEDLEREIQGKKNENKKGEKLSSAEKISRLEEEVEGLRNRLSKIAGAQLIDNNPAIADLSDPNRPLSLGEKFSELYDNEWTDAMEELSDSLDERAVIKQLLDIVVNSYKFCCDRSDKFMDRINGTLQLFSTDPVSEMSKEISKTNKDFRKSLAVHCVSHLQEEFTKQNSRANTGKKTKAYMKKCVQVCWFMTVHDPKVVINHNVTGQFDEDRFKAYTKKGKHVDYLVWPALHLHEGGPMIGKGVVQGK